MKKTYFFREYPIHDTSEAIMVSSSGSSHVATMEVDFDQIEQQLPIGSRIKHETIQTVIKEGKFIVYGEYNRLEAPLPDVEAAEAKEIDLREILDQDSVLPSIN